MWLTRSRRGIRSGSHLTLLTLTPSIPPRCSTIGSLERSCLQVRKEPKPVCVERAFPAREVVPKLHLNVTMELLTRVLGASDEDAHLSALSPALKTELWLSNLNKPSPTRSPSVGLLTRGVKSCRCIRSSPMDRCSGPFHPRVRTTPVCSVGDTSTGL